MGPADKRPAGAGADLERLIAELASKGWGPRRIEALRTSWEHACHDPMGRGRGGPSLPENAPARADETGRSRPLAAGAPERNPVSWRDRSDLVELLDRTAPWAGPSSG